MLQKQIQETCNQKKELLLHYKQLLYSEEDVKVKIILPILIALGYDPCLDLTFEVSNKCGRIDIKINCNNTSVILEAKKLSLVLTAKEVDQLQSYMRAEQAQLGILTNGKDWEFYLLNNNNPIKIINLEYGLYGDDLTFLLQFYKNKFNLNYFLSYNEFA